MNYEPLLDRLMEHFTSGDYQEEAAQAKTEFFKYIGNFDEESPNSEMKIFQFVDWYIFTRPMETSQLTPLVQGQEITEVVGDDKNLYKNLLNHRHSLFEFLKVKGEDVHIRDLFSGYKMVLEKSPVTLGFEKGQLFETRLIPHEESFCFARSFCLHPLDANKFILGEIKLVEKVADDERNRNRSELLWRLFRMRHKWEQYGHLQLSEIYANGSRLGL